jgi:tetratricopeptide (TPR) repeat protein
MSGEVVFEQEQTEETEKGDDFGGEHADARRKWVEYRVMQELFMILGPGHLGKSLINLACLTVLAIALRAGMADAQDRLPPVRQLIAETLALCNADRESNSLALYHLAEAQCYLGEFAAARKILPPYTQDNFFRQAAYQTCAEIEIELTGSTASVPDDLWKDGFGFMHADAALAFVERGEIDKTLQHVEEIPRTAHSAFNVSGVKLVQRLKDRNQHEACRKVLLHWASCYERAETVFHYRDSHRVPQLVAWLVEFNERPAATALCEHWHAVLRANTDIDENGEFIGRAWAEYGLALAALGEKDGAGRALREAHQWIDKARAIQLDPEKRITYFNFAKAYSAIAGRQAVVLGAEQALVAYNQSYELARLSVDESFGEYAFEMIVDEQLRAGDTKGARETIKRVLTPRYIGRSWRSICAHHLAQGDTGAAREAARAAVEALDRDGFEPFMAQDMAPVAATAAAAGEKELAQRLIRRALALSETNETPKFNHPWIAGIQAQSGLFAEAYRTIQSIEEPADRVQPLAQLCRALAKAERAAQKLAGGQQP